MQKIHAQPLSADVAAECYTASCAYLQPTSANQQRFAPAWPLLPPSGPPEAASGAAVGDAAARPCRREPIGLLKFRKITYSLLVRKITYSILDKLLNSQISSGRLSLGYNVGATFATVGVDIAEHVFAS